MAVPFCHPDDEADIDEIFYRIYTLLRKLQVEVKKKERAQQSRAVIRARFARRTRRNRENATGTAEESSLSNTLPSIVENLALLTERTSSGDLANPVGACDSYPKEIGNTTTVADDAEANVQDWRQVEEMGDSVPSLAKKAFLPENLLKRFIPQTISSSLWTAVICVVGWHLLR